jgi:hypothetical protein
MHSLRTRLLIVPVIALMGGLSFFLFACGGGDDKPSAEEIQEVEDVARQLFESGGSDADFVFAHVTDNLIENVFFSTREDCQANAVECIGDPSTVESIADTDISGDTATATVTVDFGTFVFGLVREDDVWKGDSLSAASDELPEGAAAVDLSLVEFAFDFSSADIPADGNFGFAVTNDGEQVHEVILQKVPEDLDLEEAIAAEEPPAGVEDVAFKVFITPGQEVNMVLGDAPLEPGRYALICFFPDSTDPEGPPHAFKGMLSEFTIE